MKRSIFKTAETLESKGFLPFFYACLSLKSASRYKKIIADTGLFIAFRPVVGGAKHGAVANIRCATIAPCGNMVCVHFFQLIIKRHDAKDDKKTAEHKALCYVMLYIIEERAKDVLADGEVELDELRRLHHCHKVYKALGGNGDANSLMERLESLPIVNE